MDSDAAAICRCVCWQFAQQVQDTYHCHFHLLFLKTLMMSADTNVLALQELSQQYISLASCATKSSKLQSVFDGRHKPTASLI